MRIHIIAISSITIVVLVMYLIIGPKKEVKKAEFSGSNYVQISSATWGFNCNNHIRYAIKEAEAAMAEATPEARKDIKIPEPVTRNNALIHLSDLCNGKEACTFLAESDVIGLDPIYSCFKDLEVTYRCFDIDRLRYATIHQGEVATLDCSAKALATPPSAR